MGNSQLSKKELKEIQVVTRYKLTKKDIKEFHKMWHQMFPKGTCDKENFKKFARGGLPQAPKDANVDFMFRAMDRDKNGEISFKEFLMYQAVMSPDTSPMELIDVAFSMYDEDSDGYVTVDEMRDCLTNMYKAHGQDVTSTETQTEIEGRIKSILTLCNKEKEKRITKDELIAAYKKFPKIVNYFMIDDDEK